MTVVQRLFVACAVMILAASPAIAASPTEDLKGYIDRVVTVLEKPEMKDASHAAERQGIVRSIANEGLDMGESSRRVLGDAWKTKSAAERARFTELFTSLIYSAYLSKVAGYDGEKMAYDGESVTDREAIVRTRVLARGGGVTPVTFHLVRDAAGRWRVWNAEFEGMSLVGNYHAQFSRIIRTASYDELVKRLEERTKALATK